MTAGSVVQKKKGEVKPHLHRIRAFFTHQAFRRLVQFSFAAFIAYITFVHVAAGESSTVITASPEAYSPFGGLETFYKYIVSGGTFVPHTHLSNLVVAVAALLTALLGIWSISGKIDDEGKAIQPSAADVNSIKGWMTLEQVSAAFGVPVSEILSAFDLPADTPASTPLKELESDTFDMTLLREWLQEQSQQP